MIIHPSNWYVFVSLDGIMEIWSLPTAAKMPEMMLTMWQVDPESNLTTEEVMVRVTPAVEWHVISSSLGN